LRREFGVEQGVALDAFYVGRFLARHAADVRGALLEDGAAGLARKVGGSGVGSVQTRENPGVPTENAFDCIMSVDALARAADPRAEVAALHAGLRPGGVLLVAVAGLRQRRLAGIAARPELWHFTSDGLRLLLEEAFGAGRVDIETHGTVRAAAALLYGVPEARLPPAALQPADPDYEVVVAARAIRAG
jgi:SAM-dependent methyltransferase